MGTLYFIFFVKNGLAEFIKPSQWFRKAYELPYQRYERGQIMASVEPLRARTRSIENYIKFNVPMEHPHGFRSPIVRGDTMIISSVTIPEFGPEQSKQIIGGLSRLYTELAQVHPPGFIQSLLMREDEGQALLLTMWESRQDLTNFVGSELGRKLSAMFLDLIESETLEQREYYVTWQTDTR
jgi:hypothetical protein